MPEATTTAAAVIPDKTAIALQDDGSIEVEFRFSLAADQAATFTAYQRAMKNGNSILAKKLAPDVRRMITNAVFPK